MSALQLWQQDLARLLASPVAPWLTHLTGQLEQWQHSQQHGEWTKWLRTIDLLPELTASHCELGDTIRLGPAAAEHQQAQLRGLLSQLMPWRKGPFDVFGVEIDTEWRSDLKWQRLLPHISDLQGRQVLDVGCGSGYHLWRMQEAGATDAWGIDPGQLFVAQFLALRRFMPATIAERAHMFPLGIEQMPTKLEFDTVFSMGVLYHRRSPIDFLSQLHQQLRQGGELVLETIVVEGDENTVLVPGERYAKMRNVWFLPSCAALCHWLKRVGFSNVRVADVATTSIEEQRRTDWMQGESLSDFLDPKAPELTIEGYQAPRRAVLLATK